MAHNLGTNSLGTASMAFRGDRNDIWHRLGSQHQDGWTINDWAKHAGLDFEAIKVPAIADLSAIELTDFASREATPRLSVVDGRHFVCRNDNGHILSPGTVTDRYCVVQPREVLDWFERYIKVDPRFQLDVAGALKTGEIIWATATFNGDTTIAGSKHKARLLMTTTFDGTGSTINRGTMTRVVCNNTLDVAMADKGKSVVRTRHNTKFDAEKVGKELASIASGFDTYKAMGEAMASHHITERELSNLFKATLDIDPTAKPADVSTRKKNQFEEMVHCYKVGTNQEGLEKLTAWSGIQAVTRYADHNRSQRGDNPQETRFLTSTVDASGSGQALKAKAVAVLESYGCSWDNKGDDMAALLKQSFRPASER